MTKVDYEITYSNPPNFKKYSPMHNRVSGTLRMIFNQPADYIQFLDYSIVTTVQICYFEIIERMGVKSKNRIQKESVIYVKNKRMNLDDVLPNKFNSRDNNLCLSFFIDFNDNVNSIGNFLPSSCLNYGNMETALVSVIHEVRVNVVQFRNGIEYIYDRCVIPLFYQAGIDDRLRYENNKNVLTTSDSQLFDKKEREYYFSEETGKLTSIAKKNSLFFRKRENSNRYDLFTKSIPLSVSMKSNEIIDITKPFINQFTLTLSSDLKTQMMYNNQTNDFQFNNKSTKLGLFKIKSLQLEQKNQILIDGKINDTVYTPLLNIQFNEFYLDIKDFMYDKSNDIYKLNISSNDLLKHSKLNLKYSLFDLMGSKVVMTNGITNIFENKTTVSFNWTISDGINDGNMRIYHLETNSTFDLPDMYHNYNPKSRDSLQEISEKKAMEKEFEYSSQSFPPPPPSYEESEGPYYDIKEKS